MVGPSAMVGKLIVEPASLDEFDPAAIDCWPFPGTIVGGRGGRMLRQTTPSIPLLDWTWWPDPPVSVRVFSKTTSEAIDQ